MGEKPFDLIRIKKKSATTLQACYIFKACGQDFPGGTVVKNLPASAGDRGSIPGLGRSHMPRSN